MGAWSEKQMEKSAQTDSAEVHPKAEIAPRQETQAQAQVPPAELMT